MKKRLSIQNAILGLILVTQISCATIFHSKHTYIQVTSLTDCTYVALSPDTNFVETPTIFKVPRSSENLALNVKRKSEIEIIMLQARLSNTYLFANFLSPYYLGYLIDLTNQKRFTYPKQVILKPLGKTLICKNNLSKIKKEVKLKSDKNFISISPLALIKHGVKINYEHQFNPYNYWTLGMELNYRFLDETDNFHDDFNEIQEYWGFGIDLGHKRFIENNDNNYHFYYHYSLGYHWGSMKSLTSYFEKQTNELGHEIFYPVTGKLFDKTHKIGFNTMLGIRFRLLDQIYTDFFVGMGMRHSFVVTQKLTKPSYNEYVWSPGYSGVLPLGGFKIGIYF